MTPTLLALGAFTVAIWVVWPIVPSRAAMRTMGAGSHAGTPALASAADGAPHCPELRRAARSGGTILFVLRRTYHHPADARRRNYRSFFVKQCFSPT